MAELRDFIFVETREGHTMLAVSVHYQSAKATGFEPQPSAWELKFSLLYFHNLQNRSGKINVHATHTVHAVPDLRVAGGCLGDGFSSMTGVCDSCFERACAGLAVDHYASRLSSIASVVW